jgi:hypothetical protein
MPGNRLFSVLLGVGRHLRDVAIPSTGSLVVVRTWRQPPLAGAMGAGVVAAAGCGADLLETMDPCRGRAHHFLRRRGSPGPNTPYVTGWEPAISVDCARLQIEQLSQPLGLRAAHWDFGLLFVVHPQLIARLEPGHHFADLIDIHHEAAMGAPEARWVEQFQ